MEVDITRNVMRFFRYGLLGIFMLAVLVAGGVYVYQYHQSYLTVDAEVAGTAVEIKAQSDGKIVELLVKDGSEVEAGTPIARLAPNVTEDEIAQLEQTAALAERNLKELQQGQKVTIPAAEASATGANPAAQQDLANAAARMQRMNELFEMGAISAVKRDEAAADYDAAQAAANSSPPAASYQTITQKASPEMLKNAELQLKQARAALESAQQAMKATEITAPVSGTVSYGDLAVGSSVRAGDSIASIRDVNDVWVAARIPAREKEIVHLGQLIDYEMDGHHVQGTIQEVVDAQPSDDVDSDEAQMVTVKISVPNDADFSIVSGMEANVRFPIRK